MNKHSSPVVVVIVLLIGLAAAVGCSEIAIQFQLYICFLPAAAVVMTIAFWLMLLMPSRPSAREVHRILLMEELQRLQTALDHAIRIGDESLEVTIRGWIKEVKAEPDFSFTSWD